MCSPLRFVSSLRICQVLIGLTLVAGSSEGKEGSKLQLQKAVQSPAIQSRTIVGPARIRVIEEKKEGFVFNRGGPVISTDPWFTRKIGTHSLYRDALDPKIAYYEPEIRISPRTGTRLAAGLPEPLAGTLDAFLFRYFNFDNTNPVKYGQVQIAIEARQPEWATIEEARKCWREIEVLRPLELVFVKDGIEIQTAYPKRQVRLQEVSRKAMEGRTIWEFESEGAATPALLLQEGLDSFLNQGETLDFLQVISADLEDMPAFQATLSTAFQFDAWNLEKNPSLVTLSPIRAISSIAEPVKSKPVIAPKVPAKKETRIQSTVGKKATAPMIQKSGGSIVKTGTLKTTVGSKTLPADLVSKTELKRVALKPFTLEWIGQAKPRTDLKYKWGGQSRRTHVLSLNYNSKRVRDYDYYFLSGSGRWGGPFLNVDPMNPLPDHPVKVSNAEGWDGYWYETHYSGDRVVWVAPRTFGLQWKTQGGISPSCKFAVKTGGEQVIQSRITYEFYPEIAVSELENLRRSLEARSGETVRILPLTQWWDFQSIQLDSSDPLLSRLVREGNLSITSLQPASLTEPWMRVELNLTSQDWSEFSLFMRNGDAGTWSIGVRGGLAHDRMSFSLNGNLLDCRGAPLWSEAKLAPGNEGILVLDWINFGFLPYVLEGFEARFYRKEQAPLSAWIPFGDNPVLIPEVNQSSSVDQQSGGGAGLKVVTRMPMPEDLKERLGLHSVESIEVQIVPEWVQSPEIQTEKALDADVVFSYLRSLCYQYVGESEVIELPVSVAEQSQWSRIQQGVLTVRYQGYVYRMEIQPGQPNNLRIRRLPREGVYANLGGQEEDDSLEYHLEGVSPGGEAIRIPADETYWAIGKLYGITLPLL
jgi:hypothetical protein